MQYASLHTTGREVYKTGSVQVGTVRSEDLCGEKHEAAAPCRGQFEQLPSDRLSVLIELHMVTLMMREHRMAFTKDIWKFYPCVEADQTAQHVRWILQRFGDFERAWHVCDHGSQLKRQTCRMHSNSSSSGDSREIQWRKEGSFIVPKYITMYVDHVTRVPMRRQQHRTWRT
jgi:hypothetical protein